MLITRHSTGLDHKSGKAIYTGHIRQLTLAGFVVQSSQRYLRFPETLLEGVMFHSQYGEMAPGQLQTIYFLFSFLEQSALFSSRSLSAGTNLAPTLSVKASGCFLPR